MAKKILTLVVDPKGQARHFYSEEVDLSALGKGTLRRASHVEPTESLSNNAIYWLLRESKSLDGIFRFSTELARKHPNSWWSDLLPINGPVLGPFDKRSQALQAEIDWITENVLGVKQKKETI